METLGNLQQSIKILPQELSVIAGQVHCCAWKKSDFVRVRHGELAIWVPYYGAEGVDYSRAFLAPPGSDIPQAFEFSPKTVWSRQTLMLVDFQFLPEGMDYLPRLFSVAHRRNDLAWIPFPINNSLEDWFVARDKARQFQAQQLKCNSTKSKT